MKQTPGKCPRCGARRVDDQIGLEETPDQYVAKLVEVFREVRRVLRDDGTLWLNLGDSYASGCMSGKVGPNSMMSAKQQRNYGTFDSASGKRRHASRFGLKPKDLIGIPWRVAFALQADGWWLRSEIIWHKKAPMPESVRDRPTRAHEQVFLLTKAARYFYDADAIAEAAIPEHAARYKYNFWSDGTKEASGGGRPNGAANTGGSKVFSGKRNRRSVWTLGPEPYRGAHFATMPTKLVEPCILAGSKPGDTVLDPFAGSGTTGYVALTLGRRFVGIELNPNYMRLIERRLSQAQLPLLEAI